AIGCSASGDNGRWNGAWLTPPGRQTHLPKAKRSMPKSISDLLSMLFLSAVLYVFVMNWSGC
ncbi:MAG TPA: hypothetical protein VIV60_28525, partial [Polyangiaceae bacterium]